MKIMVASVIYMEAIEYFEDFINSLHQQDFIQFDILLINDNIPMYILKDKLKKIEYSFLKKICIINKNDCKLHPYELRIEMLDQALKKGMDLVLLLDFDDVAKKNRVKETVRQFDSKFAFFYNEIVLFNGNKVMPDLPDTTNGIEYIRECNYLGLSNCALNMKYITKEFIQSLRDGKTKVFDWYLFSRILLQNMKGKKIFNTCTYYRIHGQNIAGIFSCTPYMLEEEKRVKLIHYNLLKKYDKYYEKLIDKYKHIDLKKAEYKKGNKLYYWWGILSEEGE